MPRAEEPIFDELSESLVVERKSLETFHKSTVEEPYHEFLTTFPLQSSYLTGIETLDVAAERNLHLSDLDKRKAWSKAPKTKFSYTTLHEIIRSGDLKTLQAIVDNNPIDLNCQSRSGRTALHYAILMGHDEMVGFLLSRNVDVSIVDKVGCNALHLAVALNRESLAKALLTLGLDFSQKNNAGHRPLEIMALNVLGFKNTNLYKHLIKLIIKRQTGIVESWMQNLYSCGIFEMLISPRELTGSQLLQLQDQNSEAFLGKWKCLQSVMDPEFKSTGRSTLPGQGFRDDRPSSLLNGRYLELWSKYYDSLKLGCKPTVICKFSKKTEPDTVHLKYEIRGIRKGRYDPEFIDMGSMILHLRNDLILKEDVDPDISVEQPEVVKPTSSVEAGKSKKEKGERLNKKSNIAESEASNPDKDSYNMGIIDQEIHFMIEMIEIVSQIVSYIEILKPDEVVDGVGIVEQKTRHMIQAIDIAGQTSCIADDIHSANASCGEEYVRASADVSSFVQISNTQLQLLSLANKPSPEDIIVADNAVGTSVSIIRHKSELATQLISIERESNFQEVDDQERVARVLREGPIVDLRSLPWENQSACFKTESESIAETDCITQEPFTLVSNASENVVLRDGARVPTLNLAVARSIE
jgi:hypothetical protein